MVNLSSYGWNILLCHHSYFLDKQLFRVVKITLSHQLIKEKFWIWGSGSLWTQRTDDQV